MDVHFSTASAAEGRLDWGKSDSDPKNHVADFFHYKRKFSDHKFVMGRTWVVLHGASTLKQSKALNVNLDRAQICSNFYSTSITLYCFSGTACTICNTVSAYQ